MKDIETARLLEGLQALSRAKLARTVTDWSIESVGSGELVRVSVRLPSGRLVGELGRNVTEAFDRMGATLERLAFRGGRA